MSRPRPLPRRAARWLLLAWVLFTLAPSISRAAAFVQGQIAPWSAVCSALSEPRAGGSPDGGTLKALQHLTEHCPACVHAGDGWAPPPSPAGLAPADRRAAALPRLFLSAPRPLHAWATAQPRAPPALA